MNETIEIHHVKVSIMLKRVMWMIAGAVAFYAVVGSLVLPRFLELDQKMVSEFAEGYPGAHLSIGSAMFNPFTAELHLQRVTLVDPYGLELLKVGELYADIEPFQLRRERITVRQLTLSDVQVRVAQFRDGRWSCAAQTAVQGTESAEAAYFYQLVLPGTRLEGLEADLEGHRITLGPLWLDAPRVSVTRVQPFGTPAAVEATVPEPESAAPWRLDMGRVTVASGVSEFHDFNIPGAAYSIQDKIGIVIDGISSDAKSTMRYDVAMRLDGSGSLEGNGTLRHTPLQHRGRLKIDRLPLKPGASYLKRFTYALLDSGSLSLDLNASFDATPEGNRLEIVGSHALNDIRLIDTRDNTTLMSLREVRAEPVRFTLDPDALEIGTVTIDGFHASVKHTEKVGWNVATLVKASQAQEQPVPEANATKGRHFAAKIGKIVLKDNGVDLSDSTLTPPFHTSLSGLEGSISGISSDLSGRSRMSLEGVVDRYGTLGMSADLAAARPARYTEATLRMRNLDMSRFTPYAVKFVGRKIDGGKLFLDLDYKVENSGLDGRNGVKIKKVALGDAVESPDAVSLPLDLAVALLEDREGVIAAKMPVQGNLDDPDFKYGAAVWKAVFNILSNAATAPFRFLGSMLGIEGERLKAVSFACGSNRLAPSERETLDLLATALTERPGLVLEAAGRYDAASDGAVLRMQRAEALLYAEGREPGDTAADAKRLEKLLGDALAPEALEQLRDELQERHSEEVAYHAAYRQALMEHLATQQQIAPEVLIALARDRGTAVREYLLGKGVSADQLRIPEPMKAEEAVDGRVEIPLGIGAH